MNAYVHFAKKSFRRKAVYRLEYFLGLFNAVLMLFIGVAIWSALYHNDEMIDGVSKSQMITYAVLGMIMRTMLSMNEFLIDGKIRSGEIASDLLKPLYFPRYIFSIVLGEVGFNLWTKVLPVVVLSFLVFHLDLPSSVLDASLFVLSLILAYLTLYYLNFLFWMLSFWIHHTWSMVTIKNAILLLLSGATIPLWFLPGPIQSILGVLPFQNIYFTPLSIYLGQTSAGEAIFIFVQEIVWIFGMYLIGRILWKRAQKRLIIHGG
ncbi:ABC-2 family transporter protein [Paenibacillus sp. NEAU-GSW1]|uniref:ABC transporter permease n=1 Tax=Paenibacillus sp. NEAU-GSW1 TaxID=2682486 RepID=UPI0012E1347A|nr:ABC-2 family transporter protein [Paenibacillus sp. NEAU-GSW1]MUT64910.1 ABC transporter permease [Paenibacillus sp. NEAU-GSW1]